MSLRTRLVLLGSASVLLYGANDWVQHLLSSNNVHAVTAYSDVTAASGGNSSALLRELLSYVAVNAGLFWIYASVIALCRRGDLDDTVSRRLAIAFPLGAHVLLLAAVPTLSQDIYSYMAHGYLGQIPGGNPLLQPGYAIGETELGHKLATLGWHGRVAITPYGILWTRLEMLLMRLADGDIAAAILYFKTVAIAASLCCAALIWIVLGRITPRVQLLGTLVYLWNPLVIVEIAGEGHNDAFMLVFVLGALALGVLRKPSASLASLLLGVLVKYLPAMFGLAQIAFLWRTRRTTRSLATDVVLAVLAVAVVGVALYWPLWAGAASFRGILERSQPIISASPVGGLNWVLRHTPWMGYSRSIIMALLIAPATLLVIWRSLKVNDAANLLRSYAWISLVYVLLASPDFWPWYSVMPIALIAAAGPTDLFRLVLFVAAAGRFTAPLALLFDQGFASVAWARGSMTGFGTSIPFVLVAIFWIRSRWGGYKVSEAL